MEIKNVAKAGTLESNDVLIMVMPSTNPPELEIEIESIVKKQFGEAILKVVTETLAKLDITEGKIIVQDKGALDYTMRSRIETAVKRAQEEI